MKRPLFFAFSTFVLLVVLSACGGTTSPSKSINVTMTDFMFSPNTYSVHASAQISFRATNNGAVAHSFIIMKLGQKVQTHFTDADKANIFWELAQINPGQSVNESFTAPTDPGEYQVICGESNHFEAGMVAKLVVVK